MNTVKSHYYKILAPILLKDLHNHLVWCIKQSSAQLAQSSCNCLENIILSNQVRIFHQNLKLKLWILVRVWWRWMERNSWVYPTNKIRRWWIQNSSSQENGWTRTRSCYRSCPQFKKETFKSRIKGSHKLWIINPSFGPWIHFPIKKPQLTFYHLRDDLCFYWVKITFWLWIFFI